MKKAICILLAVLMISGVAGCSSSQAPSSSSQNGKATASTESAQTASAATNSGWLRDKVVTINVMMYESSTSKISNEISSFVKMKELIGVQLNMIMVPSSDYNQKKATLMATADVPDIMQVNRKDLDAYGREGSFYDLTGNISGMKHFKPLYDANPEVKFQLVDGKFYGFPTLSRYDILRGSCIMIRKDIFDSNKIAIPETFNQLYDALKKLKQIYPEKIPFISRSGADNLMTNLGYSMGSGNNLSFDPNVNGGSYIYAPAYEPTKEVLTFLARMYKEKLMDPDYTSISSTQWQEKIANGTGLVYYDNPTMAASNLSALREKEPNAEWSPIMMPKNSYGYSRGKWNAIHQLDRIWAVGSGTHKDKVDVIVGMFDWLYSDEGCDLFNLGIEGEDFVKNAKGEVTFTNALIKKYTKADGSFDSVALNSDKGIAAAYSSFVPYSDMHSYQLMWPQYQLDWYRNYHAIDPAYALPAETPPLTKKESDRVASLQTALNTESAKMYNNLILGVESVDQFSKYVDTFTKIGYKELEQIMNTARNRASSQK